MTKAARKNMKDQLLHYLSDSGWSLESIDSDTDWWVDEHWIMSSQWQKYGEKIWISFMVDPQYEGKHKQRAIWFILASEAQPESRLDMNHRISALGLGNHFNREVKRFLSEINDYRNTL